MIAVKFVCLFFWRNSPQWERASTFTRFLYHTHRRATVGGTPLDEWSARRKHTQNSQQTNTHAPGVIRTHDLSSERPQTDASDGAATETSFENCSHANILEENPSYKGCFVQLRKMNWIQIHILLLVTIRTAVIIAALFVSSSEARISFLLQLCCKKILIQYAWLY